MHGTSSNLWNPCICSWGIALSWMLIFLVWLALVADQFYGMAYKLAAIAIWNMGLAEEGVLRPVRSIVVVGKHAWARKGIREVARQRHREAKGAPSYVMNWGPLIPVSRMHALKPNRARTVIVMMLMVIRMTGTAITAITG